MTRSSSTPTDELDRRIAALRTRADDRAQALPLPNPQVLGASVTPHGGRAARLVWAIALLAVLITCTGLIAWVRHRGPDGITDYAGTSTASPREQLAVPAGDVGSDSDRARAQIEAQRLLSADKQLQIMPAAKTAPPDLAQTSDAFYDYLHADFDTYRSRVVDTIADVRSQASAPERSRYLLAEQQARLGVRLPIADDAEFVALNWGNTTVSPEEITGLVRGWYRSHWINPETEHGRIDLDSDGWDIYTDGKVSWWVYRLVFEEGQWKLDGVEALPGDR